MNSLQKKSLILGLIIWVIVAVTGAMALPPMEFEDIIIVVAVLVGISTPFLILILGAKEAAASGGRFP